MGEDHQHPPVPPSDSVRLGKHEKTTTSRTLERERQETACPQCSGPVYYIEKTTGRVIIDMWDPETFDNDEFDLSQEREEIERFQECGRCGWRVYV
jgi:DNA-directed RNA polymerase subunit RPC12/RpoP